MRSDARLSEILHGRRILLIGVKFYHYNEEIIRKMESYGAEVSFYYERDTSLMFGLTKFLKKGKTDRIQHRHYQQILRKIAGKPFDYLLVIRGYKLQSDFVEAVKQMNPGIKTILYQWDSYKIWDCDYRHLIPAFDVVKTFDYQDAEELSLPYVPTFSTDEFRKLKAVSADFDLFYCGNYTYPRYEFLLALIRFAQQNGYKLHTRLVMTWRYFLQEQWAGRRLNYRLVSFRKLTKNEYVDLFARSRVVVDLTSENQAGLTMRTLDALSAGKKLLTNNHRVFNEPGIHPQQVALYDPEKLVIDPTFVSDQLFEKKDYSIDRWLLSVFV